MFHFCIPHFLGLFDLLLEVLAEGKGAEVLIIGRLLLILAGNFGPRFLGLIFFAIDGTRGGSGGLRATITWNLGRLPVADRERANGRDDLLG